MIERVRLTPQAHAVYELGEGLLLVFKPAGHVESTHVHTHPQRLRVLRGQLRVDAASTTVMLGPNSQELSLVAGQEHATTALEATWLIAETKS